MKRIVVLLTLLIFVACSSTVDENVAEDTSTTSSSTTTIISNESTDTTLVNNEETATNPEIKYVFDVEKMSPFTGKELLPETWLKRPRRVIAFKIDNNINARPQSGLQEADAVHEILVEGGMTRFLAFFYDNTSKYLGPIRSARPTDPTVVRPYGGTLVVSGATAGLIPAIRDLEVPVLEEQNSPVMFRISSRNAPHNLYADTELVRERIEERGFFFLQPGPSPLYPFGFNQDNWKDGGEKVTIIYSEFTTVIWKLDNDKYSRFIIDSYAKDKDAVAHNFISQDGNYSDILQTDTIVVIQGPLYKDPATTLPSVLTVGVGSAYIFNNGKYIEGNWRRGDISESFVLSDNDGNDIEVPPSTQWVHILPNEGKVLIDN